MVKTPRTRHSKPNRPAVTIDLEANPEALQRTPHPGAAKLRLIRQRQVSNRDRMH